MQAAYVPYRAALFRSNGKDAAQATQAVEQAQRAWKSLAEQFAAKPPAPRDPAAVREALAKLKPPYSRMFLKYG